MVKEGTLLQFCQQESGNWSQVLRGSEVSGRIEVSGGPEVFGSNFQGYNIPQDLREVCKDKHQEMFP